MIWLFLKCLFVYASMFAFTVFLFRVADVEKDEEQVGKLSLLWPGTLPILLLVIIGENTFALAEKVRNKIDEEKNQGKEKKESS